VVGWSSSLADTNIRLDNLVLRARSDLNTGLIAAARALISEDAVRPRTGQITDR
jgi:hypothetical protein